MSPSPVRAVSADLGPHDFKRLADGRYSLRFDHAGVELHIDRLRRRSEELIGELTVTTEIATALTTADGVLAVSDFNFSSMTARERHAAVLGRRARTHDLDWHAVLELGCQLVLRADRDGQPIVRLCDVTRPEPANDLLDVNGFGLLPRHPAILFGDGGACKSYIALMLAGELARRGIRVGLLDWELDVLDHRDRFERIFGRDLPGDLWYARAERPLVRDVDRLRRLVSDLGLQFVIFDSVGYATEGPPESAEAALAYFQAVRRFGPIGSLHLAHISRAEGGDQKPFGSTFWHNSARLTMFVKAADDADPGSAQLGIFERKRNIGARRPPFGLSVTFMNDRTTFSRTDVADVPDLASRLPLSSRLRAALRAGARSRTELATSFPDEKPESVRRTVNRLLERGHVVRFPGPGGDERIGLAAHGTTS